MYQRILSNWPGTPCRGKQNWRWQKCLEISERNDSIEKIFEKNVAKHTGDNWVNMVPVVSGVMPNDEEGGRRGEEGGRRIDLAHRCSPGSYEFIELKLGNYCGHPLRAAIQILEYGLIYVFSRVHIESLGYDQMNELLRAHSISLKVLTPAESYLPGSLVAFEHTINHGLSELRKAEGLDFVMDFAFERFPSGFDGSGPDEGAPAVLDARQKVY
jgi:hypothetical protein